MFPQSSKQKDEYEVEDKEFLKKGVFLRRGIYQKGVLSIGVLSKGVFTKTGRFLLWGVFF